MAKKPLMTLTPAVRNMGNGFCTRDSGSSNARAPIAPIDEHPPGSHAKCTFPAQSLHAHEDRSGPQRRGAIQREDGRKCEYGTLLINAPVGRHFAQFHRDNAGLADAVTLFIDAGLQRGTGVIVIASNSNMPLFEERLLGAGIDIGAFDRAGQLRLLSAEAVMSQFMRGGMPDWTDFRRTMSPILEGVQKFGQSSTRAYGEMVNLLWKDGRQVAAVRLEEYWNELAHLYPFSLFCGYTLESHNHESYLAPLHEIGRTHSSILTSDDDEAFRTALESASKDLFGVSLTQLISCTGYEDYPGESRLPIAQRTMLWITKNIPTSSAAVLERARSYYENNRNTGTKPVRP